jgi:hypothetical protein
MNLIRSLLNWGAHEEDRFTRIYNQGPFELRLYQKLLCAKISTNGIHDNALKSGLKELFGYIKGNNFN